MTRDSGRCEWIPHFFPDFLIPCEPLFMGPLPLALSIMSFFALASVAWNVSGCKLVVPEEDSHTSLLLLLECDLLIIHVLLVLLRGLQRLDFAACLRPLARSPYDLCDDKNLSPSRLAPPILNTRGERVVFIIWMIEWIEGREKMSQKRLSQRGGLDPIWLASVPRSRPDICGGDGLSTSPHPLSSPSNSPCHLPLSAQLSSR